MQPNLIGQTLGKYRVVERLGQGENAVVYKAQQLNLSRFVTLKVLEASNRDGHERLKRESQVLAQFQHPGIRQVYSIETFGPYVFAVLEYTPLSLKTLLNERLRQNRPFTRGETVDRLDPIAEVLDYLHHHSWVHLDIKPENILIGEDGRARLADFGVAQPFGKPQTHGTPAYVAPEVVRGEDVGPAADIYSLGIVAYEMMAGRPPFGGDTALGVLRQHTQVLPTRLDRLDHRCSNSVAWAVDRALVKDPRRRYVSAHAFVNALITADTVSVRMATLPRRRPAATALSAVSLACVVGLGVWQPWSATIAPVMPAPSPQPVVMVTRPPAATEVLAPTTEASQPMSAPNGGVILQPTGVSAPGQVQPTQTLAPTRTPAPTKTSAPAPTATSKPAGPACVNAEVDPGAVILAPQANARLARGQIAVRGTADRPDSVGYEFQLHSPAQTAGVFSWKQTWDAARVRDGLLWTWNAGDLQPGPYMLRLRVKLNNGNYKDCDVPVTLE